MKKFLTMLLATLACVTFVLGFSACGDKKNEAENSGENGCKHVTETETGHCADCGYPILPTEGVIYEVSKDCTYASVIDYEGTATRVRIADNYKGIPVTEIGKRAFEFCYDLLSVEIPNSVKSIGMSAFGYCESLMSIEIPNSVTSIGTGAFIDCYSLTEIVIPDSVTNIDYGAFRYLSCLTIYCEVKSQPEGWSNGWSDDSPVVWDCKNNDVATDGNIYTVIDGVRYAIKDDTATVVKQANNIPSAIILSEVTYKNVTYPVTRIGEWAFAYCVNLTNLVIPDSVTSIGEGAFETCASLTEIVIPDSVTSIGETAFLNCNSLTIYCEVESQPSGWASDWSGDCSVVWGYKGE